MICNRPHKMATRSLLEQPLTSARFRILPRFSGCALLFRPVPLWADFTPSIVVIFINNLREELGVL
jgi:hypothetical protein